MRVVLVCAVALAALAVPARPVDGERGGRRLFGGYRITPRSCRPSRPGASPAPAATGLAVCMFNGECARLGGAVAGACMDGFLFGACCALPADVDVGDLVDGGAPAMDNRLSGFSTATGKPSTTPADITMQGVSQITASLINQGMLPTAQDNEMVQVNDLHNVFSTTGVTHPQTVDTIINHSDNEIRPSHFKPTTQPMLEDRKTTTKIEDSTNPYPDTPIIQISVSNAPIGYTPIPTIQRPIFRPKPPKPTDEKYVLVPTISHEPEPNRTQEHDSILNILEMLNQTSTNKPFIKDSSKYPMTSRKPPSTSYVFSTTIPPRRPTQPTPEKKKPTKTKNKTTKKPPSTSYVYSSTFKPVKSTLANSPAAFVTSSTPLTVSNSTPRPSSHSTIQSTIAGPSFSVTSRPAGQFSSTLRPTGQYSSYPSPAPTLIVLGHVEDNEIGTEPYLIQSSPLPPSTTNRPPSSYGLSTTYRPPGSSSALPTRRPVNHVTVNNHVTQNIYSTQRPYISERPSPTVLITPKPTISSSSLPQGADSSEAIEVTSSDELSNFPPVRNPNLNMSAPVISDDDITTPTFVEDAVLNDRVESFVNQIIIGLQEPFEGLKDIVYNKNKTSVAANNTTKKPVNKQGTTTKRPATRPTSSSVASTVRTTRRTTTRRTTTTVPTRRQTTATRRTTRVTTRSTTRKPSTTTQNLIEHEDNSVDTGAQESYRNQCGVRPLVKSGRIVGGKGASFGEFPWQVLVRESTWLGLFTKNKCGGVLISDRYVMTAAHCQPGFLASLVAVFGEFDISGDLETRRPVTRNVKRVIVHRKYDAATFENDLALLELESPVTFDAHIIPICLPRTDEDFTNRVATVTGWGRLRYGGGVPSVLQAVQVPVIENHVCQEMFRTAGHAKVILDSFLCAGYANGQKDSCEGDSGGPLVLQRPDGRYQLAGTVSHGIKCAAPYLPGVYMRTTFFKPWITSITGIQ